MAIDTKQISEELLKERKIRNRMPIEEDPYEKFGTGANPEHLSGELVSTRSLPAAVDEKQGRYEVPSWEQEQETERQGVPDMTGWSGQRQFLGPPFGPPMAPERERFSSPVRPEEEPLLVPRDEGPGTLRPPGPQPWAPPWAGPPENRPEGPLEEPPGPPGPPGEPPGPPEQPGPPPGPPSWLGPPPGPEDGFLVRFGPPPEMPKLFPAMVPSWERR